MRPTVLCVVGTRPEAIKMAPVIGCLRRDYPSISCRVLASGQHRGLLDQALADFDLSADADLDLMRPGQGLADLTARALVAVNDFLQRERPDFVLAQGDTTTVLAVGLACHYARVPFGHVEAGLRTGLRYAPFPEEMNRVLAGRLATLHFAPTATARAHLLREGTDPATVHVTGNTVIDALLQTAARDRPLPIRPSTDRYVLVTAHRRENFGAPLLSICRALRELIERHDELSIVFPVHPNPNVRAIVTEALSRHRRVHLIEPVGYADFVALMKGSWLILTDSGGVQEEGPSLGKPVLVLREATERPEAVAAGVVQLVGTDAEAIVTAVEAHRSNLDRPTQAMNPYGDGHAAERICGLIAQDVGLKSVFCGDSEFQSPT